MVDIFRPKPDGRSLTKNTLEMILGTPYGK